MKIQALSLFLDCFRIGHASQPTGEPGFACCGHLTSSTGSTNFSRRRSLVGHRPPPKVASLPLAIWVGASKVPPGLGARPSTTSDRAKVNASTASGVLMVDVVQSSLMGA